MPDDAARKTGEAISSAINSMSRVLQVLDSHATLPHEFTEYDKACRAELSAALKGLLEADLSLLTGSAAEMRERCADIISAEETKF